ncbi:Outer membrane protein MIP [BD1-7 clade bacterium]|uniref:Peptidyl-prolyl cis-trans isomerase n=1 Tax=BD1-7 clade bacterium TaxID=2029982 RepID=A0A5S9QGZ7_9GAMM|nr:Outer membrane protein MIP [BD1-7 clade bacterium]
MNKTILAGVIAASVALTACNEQKPAEPTQAEAPAVTLDSNVAKVSYGIGLNISSNFRQQNIELDKTAFEKGLADGFEGNEPALDQQSIMQAMQAFQQEQMEKQMSERKTAADENKTEGDKFLAENAKKDGVKTTDSGLQYKVVTEGKGKKPTADDTVVVHYRGTLLDGDEFDSSYSRNQPATFGVGAVIPGWTEALQLMPVGSKYELFIPADLAYGEGGAGAKIGPNETLVFEVELLEIVDPEAQNAPANEKPQ